MPILQWLFLIQIVLFCFVLWSECEILLKDHWMFRQNFLSKMCPLFQIYSNHSGWIVLTNFIINFDFGDNLKSLWAFVKGYKYLEREMEGFLFYIENRRGDKGVPHLCLAIWRVGFLWRLFVNLFKEAHMKSTFRNWEIVLKSHQLGKEMKLIKNV